MIDFDVAVVGAGAAGIGVAAALARLGVQKLVVLEREQVGASFSRWPRETRFISPSFTTNGFGMPDLNAVTPNSSPAFAIRRSHMTGPDYARYLRGVVDFYKLPIRSGVDVRTVVAGDAGFTLSTSDGELQSRFVVWAAGEQAYPRRGAFTGARLCQHTSNVLSYASIETRSPIVIGGFESGIDAAIHLARMGKGVQVVDRTAWWEIETDDPSASLSPFTSERLAELPSPSLLKLLGNVGVVAVELAPRGYLVRLDDGRVLTTDGPPLLANGFAGSLQMIAPLFGVDEDGRPLLSDMDESLRSPGLFLCGPQLHHRNQHFCYIYKFRQRFAVVASAIGMRLNLALENLQEYADANMWLDDLSCCDIDCSC